MAFRGFISRAEAGLRAPRSRSTNINARGTLAHYVGPKVGAIAHGRCDDLMRNIQNHAMDTRGWVDFPYSWAACRHGYLYAGRGQGIRTAANGTNPANYRFHAGLLLMGEGDVLTVDMRDAWWTGWEMVGGGESGNHSDVRSTACPGSSGRNMTASGPPSGLDTGVIDMANITRAQQKLLADMTKSAEEAGTNGWAFGQSALLVQALRGKMDGIEFADAVAEIADDDDTNPYAFREMVKHLRDHPTGPGGGISRADAEAIATEVVNGATIKA